MGGATGILLIALGLIMIYVILSDKYACFIQFFDCMLERDYPPGERVTVGTEPFFQVSTIPFDIFGMLKRVTGTASGK